MKNVILLMHLLGLTSGLFAQTYQGTLSYEQEIGGVKTPVSIVVEGGKAKIERMEAVKLTYTSHIEGTLEVRVDDGPAVDLPLPELDPATGIKFGKETKILNGYECRSVYQILNGGSTLEGWFTGSIQTDWNRLIRAVQGQEWGQTPGFGVMVEWEVKGIKGDVILKGRLLKDERKAAR
jgi:hypothetical protein